MSTGSNPTAPLGPPLIGALLRMPGDVVRLRMLTSLHDRGFTDIVPAHLALMRWPGPQGQRPSEIAAETGMTKQAVNYLLGQLEGLGYVERRPDTEDQRSRRVHLTPRGREAARTMRDAVTDLEAEWSALLGRDEFEQLRTLLTRLNERLTDATPSRQGPDATQGAFGWRVA
jgi:DNA-binding MarR family transcriptional regulator